MRPPPPTHRPASSATPRAGRRRRRVALAVLLVAFGPVRGGTPDGPPAPSRTPEPVADDRTVVAPSTGEPVRQRLHVDGLDLGPTVIRSAIAAADRDWTPVARDRMAGFGAAGTPRQALIDRRFAEATTESCSTNALKFDPPVLGPLVLGGLLALPFLVHAMATGRCRPTLQSPFADGVPPGGPAR